MNVVNLERLETYLLSNNLKADFNMKEYSEYGLATMEDNCGSVGCAVGHGPFLGPDMLKLKTENWNDYCERVFGISTAEDAWTWCFGSTWEKEDNTPEGAAKRIRYILNGNLIPSGFTEDFADVEDDLCQGDEPMNLDKYIDMYQ